jgi:hypothetical protein
MNYSQALQIWHDCYIQNPPLWDQYTDEQRLQAIRMKYNDTLVEYEYGYFNISDRD